MKAISILLKLPIAKMGLHLERKFIPTLMEICNYMTFADKGQEVIL